MAFACLVLVLAVAPAVNPLQGENQPGWQTIDDVHFRIHAAPQDAFYAKELFGLFQLSYHQLSDKLSIELQHVINIYLCATEDCFVRLTGNLVPHWGEGIANPARSLIVLKSPTLTDNYDRQKQLVMHELAHILVGQWSQRPLPRWFNEGIAMHLANDREYAGGEALSKALVTDSVIPLDEIETVLQFEQTKARLAYEESYLFVQFLIDEFGEDGVIKLIYALNSGGSFESIFAQQFEMALFEAELMWYDLIKKKYRWRFLMDFDTYLWIFILMVFILVIVSIKIRNRRIIRKWAEEDRISGHS